MGAKLLIRTSCAVLKINPFEICKNACFPWQPIAVRGLMCAYNITHISAVTYPRLLNIVPNKRLDIYNLTTRVNK